MISDIWQRPADTYRPNNFGTGLSLSGQRVFHEKNGETTFLGRAEDFLLVFKRLSQNNTLSDMLVRADVYPAISGYKKILNFLQKLPPNDLWSVWGFFVLHPMIKQEMQWDFLLACPKSPKQRLSFKDKNGRIFFEGSTLFFLFEGMKNIHPLFLDDLMTGRDLKSFLRKSFGNEPFEKTSTELQRFFLNKMKEGTLPKNAGYHVFLESDESAKNFLSDPVFKEFWRKHGQDNATNVLNSLIESTMSIQQKKQTVTQLFSSWNESDRRNIWRLVRCQALSNRGLFASWFAVGAALGFSPEDFLELSRDEIRRAVQARIHKPSDWVKYVHFMKNTDLFSEDERGGFLKKLWRYVCGDKDQGISVGSFVYRLSEMEAECRALLLVGLAPQNFDFKEFQKTFHLKINDKNMHTYDINSNDALHKEGLAIIERAFLRGNLLDVADASEKPSRPQRKM